MRLTVSASSNCCVQKQTIAPFAHCDQRIGMISSQHFASALRNILKLWLRVFRAPSRKVGASQMEQGRQGIGMACAKLRGSHCENAFEDGKCLINLTIFLVGFNKPVQLLLEKRKPGLRSR
jgi:hypothetical protein